MEIDAVLDGIGLSEGERKVYITLLKLGSVQVSRIKEETNLHRTTIYDFLEKLLNKGLVNYVIKNNVKFYKATDPEKLLDFIKEKEENLKSILPRLKDLVTTQTNEIKVEVYKGVEGFKTLLNDVIRTRSEFLGFGIDESRFKKVFPTTMEQYFKKTEKLGINERLLTSDATRFVYKKKTTYYRYIPEEFFNPTPTVIYGNKVAILIWEPLTTIVMEHPELADSYRKHFEMLWGMAKTEPKRKN